MFGFLLGVWFTLGLWAFFVLLVHGADNNYKDRWETVGEALFFCWIPVVQIIVIVCCLLDLRDSRKRYVD